MSTENTPSKTAPRRVDSFEIPIEEGSPVETDPEPGLHYTVSQIDREAKAELEDPWFKNAEAGFTSKGQGFKTNDLMSLGLENLSEYERPAQSTDIMSEPQDTTRPETEFLTAPMGQHVINMGLLESAVFANETIDTLQSSLCAYDTRQTTTSIQEVPQDQNFQSNFQSGLNFGLSIKPTKVADPINEDGDLEGSDNICFESQLPNSLHSSKLLEKKDTFTMRDTKPEVTNMARSSRRDEYRHRPIAMGKN